MQYWRCRCGKMEGFGSTGPRRCSWCSECKTTLALGPEGHKTEQPEHKMVTYDVELDTDAGKITGKKTACIWCHRTKADLEAANEPMKPYA